MLLFDNQFILLKNERDEWELPGGKLELGETPESCVCREIMEELSVYVQNPTVVDNWLYAIENVRSVYISTYGFKPLYGVAYEYSHEHKGVGAFSYDEIQDLHMPQGYKSSIANWYQRLFVTGDVV